MTNNLSSSSELAVQNNVDAGLQKAAIAKKNKKIKKGTELGVIKGVVQDMAQTAKNYHVKKRARARGDCIRADYSDLVASGVCWPSGHVNPNRVSPSETPAPSLESPSVVETVGTDDIGSDACLPDSLSQTELTPAQTGLVPVKYGVNLPGSVSPPDFYDAFTSVLDQLTGHAMPQTLDVGMQFAELACTAQSVDYGIVTAELIHAYIEQISAELLPSLSMMFRRLESQLTKGGVLNISESFKRGMLTGLTLFEQFWQRLNATARLLEMDYAGNSVFGPGGAEFYLENLWGELDKTAKSVGATINIVR